VKIKELFHLAEKLGAARVATGHYARVRHNGSSFELHRGRDHGKDQSYFLHMLGQAALGRLLFPLGESDKPEIRAEALRLNLPGAQKGESQELCFVPTGRYDSFVAARADGRMRPGQILNEQGEKVGEHEGIFRFTLGQRKNLGVSLGQRAYVVGVDAENATVTLGSPDSLYASSAELVEVALAADLELPLRCGVQVRYRGNPAPAEVRRVGEAVRVCFEEPQRAVVPGQFAVFYQGERVLGGGMIRSAQRAALSAPASSQESFA
jgi:tRNA-specific 2-thiouridylase